MKVPRGQRRSARWASRFLGLHANLFFGFLYFPILLLVLYSFNNNPDSMMEWQGFTLKWYRHIFGAGPLGGAGVDQGVDQVSSRDPVLLVAVKNSLIVAISTSLFSTLVGTITALAVARYRFALKRLYRGLLFMPIVVPDIVLGIALLIFFVQFGVKLGLMTIIIGHCSFLISYVFVVVSARLAGMDATLEEASADLGATPWRTFRRVTLPQIMPGVLGGFLLAFIISLDDLVLTYFVAGVGATTLPLYIFGLVRYGITPEINAISALLILFSMLVASAGLLLRGPFARR